MSSPGIVTYPLGGITYDAEDAAAYFSTRTSGVFSTEEDFAVTVAEGGGTAVTVSPGRAWMHPSRFTGQSITMREAQTVTLPQADSYLPRIDRLVLRFDATARTTTLEVLQGTAKTGPTPPDITRTEMVYDLCLCQISRPAGQTALTTANLTDTRSDETLCGLMRDGVERLPMDHLSEQAYDLARQTAALCDNLLQSYSGGYLGIWTVTLSPSGWQSCTDVPGYAHKYTAELRAARAATVPSAVPSPDTFRTAVAAGLAGVCETADGSVTFWAENVPTGSIQMQVSLLGQATASTTETEIGG